MKTEKLAIQAPRNEFLDVLRGWALVGVCIGNIQIIFFSPGFLVGDKQSLPFVEFISWCLSYFFLQEKYVTLFAVIFGIGLSKMMERRGKKHFLVSSVSRMVILMLFGVIHAGFIWSGDILFILGFSGLIIVLLSSLNSNVILIFSLACYLLLPAVFVYLNTGHSFDTYDDFNKYIHQLPNYSTSYVWHKPFLNVFSPLGLKAVLLTFVGYGLSDIISKGKLGVSYIIENPVYAFVFFTFSGTVIAVSFLTNPSFHSYDYFDKFVNYYFALLLAPSIVFAIYILYKKLPCFMSYLLADFGKTTMSSYILFNLFATLIMVFFNLQGSPVWLTFLIAIPLVFFQIFLAKFWVKKYQYGPTEWLWRYFSNLVSNATISIGKTFMDSYNNGFMRHSKLNSWISYAQYIALVCMTIEHLFRFGLDSNYWVPVFFGRWAFPFFAAMVAWHFFLNTRNRAIYLIRILILAIISQPFYALAIEDQVLANGLKLNIIFTIFMGLSISSIFGFVFSEMKDKLGWHRVFLFISPLIVLMIFLASYYVEYSLSGVLLIPSFYLFFKGVIEQRKPFLIIGLASIFTNLFLLNSYSLMQISAIFSGFFVIGLLFFSIKLPFIRQLPRWLWLSWYPAHLLIIALFSMA